MMTRLRRNTGVYSKTSLERSNPHSYLPPTAHPSTYSTRPTGHTDLAGDYTDLAIPTAPGQALAQPPAPRNADLLSTALHLHGKAVQHQLTQPLHLDSSVSVEEAVGEELLRNEACLRRAAYNNRLRGTVIAKYHVRHGKREVRRARRAEAAAAAVC